MSRTSELLQTLNLSAEQIAGRSGIGVERVREIIGGADVTLTELRALSKGLRFSFDTIARKGEREKRQDLKLLFRQVGLLREHIDPTYNFASRFVEAALEILPRRVGVPEWMVDLTPSDESYEGAETLAIETRRRLFDDNRHEPIPDLAIRLGTMAGVIVSRLSQSRFEGASLLVDGYPFIFVSPRFSGRMLFTVAHELGHVIAHHRGNDHAIFETASQIGGWRQRKHEAFVDAFASILLMPSRGVGMMLKKVRDHLNIERDAVGDIEILLLARFYGVSFDVAARRCENLQLLPPGGARSLSDDLKKKYGSAERRAEQANLPPRADVPLPQVSENLFRAIHGAVMKGSHSIGWAADQFGVSINDIFAANKKISSEYHH